MQPDKKLAIAALVIGFIVGYSVKAFVGSEPRFVLHSGQAGSAYKVDTQTGQTWFMYGSQEVLVRPKDPSQ